MSAGKEPAPRLAPALAAMTLLQALVALALFAPGAIAPRAGFSVAQISSFTTAAFAIALFSSFWGGAFIARFGALRVASFCALCIAAAMALAAWAQIAAVPLLALTAAGLAMGLAAGPETPASSALLGPLVSDGRRALVFSLRQTGNQLGAILGSITLPALAIHYSAPAAFLAVACCACVGILLFEGLRSAYRSDGAVARRLSARERLRLVTSDPRLISLSLASMPYSGMQVTLNTCFVSFGVTDLGLSHVEAGIALALAQGGGLAGRLGLGFVAMRLRSVRTILVTAGIGMAAAATIFALWGADLGRPAQFALAAVFGFAASGWNGLLVSEIASLAPQDRVAETTGAVLTASFIGLLAAPVLVAALDGALGLRGAFSVLAALCVAGAFALARKDRHETA